MRESSFRTKPDDVRHSKDDALSERKFKQMVAATHKLEDTYSAIELRLILFADGRLGLRAGELTHLSGVWMDWRDGKIPSHLREKKGRDCGLYETGIHSARQLTEYNPINLEEANGLLWAGD